MYKEKARKGNSQNPWMIKKGFYITELNMGFVPGDGYELISDSDIAGPFKTLERARAIFKKIVTDDAYRNKAQIVQDYAIKGPTHSPDGYETPWYHFEKHWSEA